MFRQLSFSMVLIALVCTACSPGQASLTPQANMPNPAAVYCEQNGGKLESRQDASGGVAGVCIFPDGSECDEWAYFRGECKPGATPMPNMPNPASVYCEQQGGQLELRQDASGGVTGVCVFPDGSECEEWAYFRGECKPGDAPQPGPTPTAAGEFDSAGWKIYRNEKLGYSFHYPAEAAISTADDPLKALTIEGPFVGNDKWPVIYVSHPGDREDYRPPEGVDLGQWLIDHNLLMPDGQPPAHSEVRLPDVQIAGAIAIHVRLARSPQTYAYDKYYFARSGQLYVVTILHTGDKEDWELYNRFLASLQFEQ